MSKNIDGVFRIRPAAREDLPELLAMIRELAEFEHLLDSVRVTVEDLERHLLGERPAAKALIGELDGEICAYAIHFSSFSTFAGRPGVWLEDLYVRPAFRGRGFGKAILREIAAIALARDAGRCEWTVLDWNRNAIDLYENIGGEVLPDWRIVRMNPEGMRRFLES